MKKVSLSGYVKAIAMLAIQATIYSYALGFLGVNVSFTGVFVSLFALNIAIGFTKSVLKYKAMSGLLYDDTLVINDTSYAGTVAPYYIIPALFSFDSIIKKVVYLKDGIKKQHTIPTMDFSGPLQPRVATPTQSGGNITIDKRQLVPKDTMAFQLVNPRNFEVHWDAENLSQTLLTRQLPVTVENYIMLLLLGRSFEQFEVMTWQGSTQYANNVNVTQFNPDGSVNPYYQLQFVDGLIKRMIADSAVYKVASPVALTSSNIGASLLSLYQSVATNNRALLAQANSYQRMKFLMSWNTKLIYEEYLTNQPYKNNDTTEAGIMRYKGWEIEVLAGMPDNTIVFTEAMATPEGNLWVGMNSTLDENFMLQRFLPASELFFFKMLMKIDVNYGRSEKVFLYTTLTANSFIQ